MIIQEHANDNRDDQTAVLIKVSLSSADRSTPTYHHSIVLCVRDKTGEVILLADRKEIHM